MIVHQFKVSTFTIEKWKPNFTNNFFRFFSCINTYTAITFFFCKTKIAHGGKKKADSNGRAVIRASFDKAGSFTVRAATTSGSCGGESDTTPVTVTKSGRHR